MTYIKDYLETFIPILTYGLCAFCLCNSIQLIIQKLIDRKVQNNLLYSTGHLDNPNYIHWLSIQPGISNKIENQFDQYDEPYQMFLKLRSKKRN